MLGKTFDLNITTTRSAVKAALNSSEELVGDGGFDEEEKQIQIYWRTGNTMVTITIMMVDTDKDVDKDDKG